MKYISIDSVLRACLKACIVLSKFPLHSVLALDPRGDVGSPREGSSEGTEHVVPFYPRSGAHGTGFLLEGGRSLDRHHQGGEEDKRQSSEHTGGHLGHEGSQDLGGRVFVFPVGFRVVIFDGVQRKRRRCRGKCLFLGHRREGRRRGKGGASRDQDGEEDEAEFRHFGYIDFLLLEGERAGVSQSVIISSTNKTAPRATAKKDDPSMVSCRHQRRLA
jgi:hypothetical protein